MAWQKKVRYRPLVVCHQFVNYATHQHGLALARVTLDPEQLTRLLWTSPLTEFPILENPSVGVSKETALGVLDASLVITRVGCLQIVKASSVFLGQFVLV